MLRILRSHLKFNEPFVSTFFFSIHKNRRSRVVYDFRLGKRCCFLEGFFGILNDQFFTKGVNVMFCAPTHANSIRIYRRKSHRVTYAIAPQSAVCSNHNSVVFSFFNFAKRNDFLTGLPVAIHWDKFIENSVV